MNNKTEQRQASFSFEPEAIPFIKRWLVIGVGALALAGLFAILLVLARTPKLDTMLGVEPEYLKELFGVALVVHVDLSVWVWFLSMIALGIYALPSLVKSGGRKLLHVAQWLFGAGAIAMAFSPLHPEWVVYKSNYIPVLENPLFLASLVLMGVGLVVMLVVAWGAMRQKGSLLHQAIALNLWIIGMAMLSFMASILFIESGLSGLSYYEHIFWGGGHVLQFAFVQMMMVAWLLLYHESVGQGVESKLLKPILWFGPVMVLFTPVVYILYDVTDYEHMKFFTWQMNIAGGAAAALLSLLILKRLVCQWSQRIKAHRACYSTLLMSLLLFISGGVISTFIREQNVIIPAHYHGSIVGVTLALMGFTYVILPKLGYKNIAHTRTAFWQPIILGGGQLLHIGGLAVSGGYGVLRKTAGGMEGLEPHVRTALGVMGGGGLLAIIGGLMFVIAVVRSVRGTKAA